MQKMHAELTDVAHEYQVNNICGCRFIPLCDIGLNKVVFDQDRLLGKIFPELCAIFKNYVNSLQANKSYVQSCSAIQLCVGCTEQLR